MAGGNAIRGSRIGAGPMGEAERGEIAPRRRVSFWCANGHESRPSFAASRAGANLSSTGAMLRIRTEVPAGREASLVIDLPTPVKTKVRVVRCEPVDVALPGAAVWRQQDFALGVHFLDVNPELAAAIRSLVKAGIEHSQARDPPPRRDAFRRRIRTPRFYALSLR